MADSTAVKQYLAHWFQLGKKIILHNGEKAIWPARIFTGDRYSVEFEDCWSQVVDPTNGVCYLEGTEQTIQELLSPAWEFHPCARCELPVPIKIAGLIEPNCTCHDLENWPNSDLPAPKIPANSQQYLDRLRHRLRESSDRSRI
jgi:hypothetical protein